MHQLHSSLDLPNNAVPAPAYSSTNGKMPDAILDDISHRRYNPLRGSWVLVSPHRTKRPWQGQQEAASRIELPKYDPSVRSDLLPDTGGHAVVNDFSSAIYVRAINAPKVTSIPNTTEPLYLSTTIRPSNKSNRNTMHLPRMAVSIS